MAAALILPVYIVTKPTHKDTQEKVNDSRIQALESAFQGQILAPLGTDWVWIQVLLPVNRGLSRLGIPVCLNFFEK